MRLKAVISVGRAVILFHQTENLKFVYRIIIYRILQNGNTCALKLEVHVGMKILLFLEESHPVLFLKKLKSFMLNQ